MLYLMIAHEREKIYIAQNFEKILDAVDWYRWDSIRPFHFIAAPAMTESHHGFPDLEINILRVKQSRKSQKEEEKKKW